MTQPERAPDPNSLRRYSGKVTAFIVVAIVVVFVLLNLIFGERFVPERQRPSQPQSTAPG